MSVKNSVKALPVSFVDTATITALTFTPIGTLSHPLFLFRVFNNSNTDVFISYDGINASDFVPKSGGILELNFQNNAQPNNFLANLAKGTTIYAVGTAGVGFVYMTGYYQPQQPS